MKISNSAIVSTLLVLLFSCSSSYATKKKKFIQCLQKHSNSISNVVYTPSNSSFDAVLRASIKNERYSTPSTPKPLAIEDVSHISATIVCAKQRGLQVRTRSGGHDSEGLSYTSRGCPFVIIDMFKYRDIDIDMESKTPWVQTGAIVGELYYKIAHASNVLGFPVGHTHSIGTGGHFSGGGYSVLMRKYGLSVDNIVDAQLVDANGKILDRKSMGEDIFLVIRGKSMETETAWVQTGAIVGELYYKIAQTSNVLGFPAGNIYSSGTGGHGVMMRKFGLTVHNIIDAQLVGANGRVLDRESMGEDIFWAIRGGGGASFGVIASWKIQLVPVPKIVTVFRINRTLEQGATNIL